MQITYVLELLKPSKRKQSIIEENILEVASNRKSIANELKADNTKLSTKDFKHKLPSALVNQNIREVKALYKLLKKSKSNKDNLDFKANQPLCFNSQNYRIKNHFVSFPLYTDKSKRYWFPLVKNDTFNKLKNHIKDGDKLGKSSLFRKRKKYYLAVTIKIKANKSVGENTMAIDIGLNQIAVASISNIKGREINRRFFNGKEASFVRKKYRSVRRSLGKAKQAKKIKLIEDKESRYVTNLNHEISRKLVNLAVQEKVATIVMEDLKNIRKTAFSSSKADKNLNSWAFYELQNFIEYKGKLEGIEIEYINPAYTSQACNACGIINKSNRKRNLYSCSCGYKVHVDLNAARNIASKTKALLEQSA